MTKKKIPDKIYISEFYTMNKWHFQHQQLVDHCRRNAVFIMVYDPL